MPFSIDNLITVLSTWNQPIWAVGGCLRDALTNSPIRDIDLVVKGDALSLSRSLSDSYAGSLALLHMDKAGLAEVVRVAFPENAITIDIASLDGTSIIDDLHARDFTINALALPVISSSFPSLLLDGKIKDTNELIDPFGGLTDLSLKRLRLVSMHAFKDDPVRILRAARIAAFFDLQLDSSLIAAARDSLIYLPQTAPERWVAELYTMLSYRHRSINALRLLDEMGALSVLIPPLDACRGVEQGLLHHWDVFEHTLQVVESLDNVVDLLEKGIGANDQPLPIAIATAIPEGSDEIKHPVVLNFYGHNSSILELLRQPLADQQPCLTLLKVAALFHDIAKPRTQIKNEYGGFRFPGHAKAGVPITAKVLQTWKMGRKTSHFIKDVVLHHMRPGKMSSHLGYTLSAARHYFYDAKEVSIPVAFFSIADHFAVYGPDPFRPFWLRHYSVVGELINQYYSNPQQIMPSPLLTGSDLIEHFELTPGSEIGKILNQLYNAQLNGEVNSLDEAMSLVREILKNKDEGNTFIL
jgi:poly(A) polymerase